VDAPGDSLIGDSLVRVRLDVGYDGTDFSGWAVQPGRRTVAGVLADTLTVLFGSVTGMTVAGRTDAGVHATGQVCHVDIPAGRWVELGTPAGDGPGGQGSGRNLVHRLAGLLPPDVRVVRAYQVPMDFDARFSATYRRYAYRVSDLPWGAPPLRHRDTLAWPRPVNVDELNEASAQLCGEHDFAAYCRRKPGATTIRTLTRFDWQRGEDGVVVATVQADAFCQAMVRSLVGALLPVGDGRRLPDWPGSLLALRERAHQVVVAPPHGLTLIAVGYPDDPAQYAQQAERTRNLRVLSR
jgi:tRNA pseudouridine38-40 synthase